MIFRILLQYSCLSSIQNNSRKLISVIHFVYTIIPLMLPQGAFLIKYIDLFYLFLNSGLFADVIETAAVAVWRCPRGTDCTPVIHKPVAEIIALLRRNQLPECHLHFLWFPDPVHEPNAVRQADTVRISDDCRLSKDVPHHQIGAFSADSRKF